MGVGAGCCKPWSVILRTWDNRTRSECAVECASNAGCGAFSISGCSSSSDVTCGGVCHTYHLKSEEELVTGACFDQRLNGNTFCYTVQYAPELILASHSCVSKMLA